MKAALAALAFALMLSAALAHSGALPSAADKGGCPNAAASQGAFHANSHSAHGPEKQGARGCAGASPSLATQTSVPTATPSPAPSTAPSPTATPAATPTATPSPEPPLGEADLAVIGAALSPPPEAVAGQQFQVRGSATFRNNGPADSALADATFTLSAPVDCTIAPPPPSTVEDTPLPVGIGVFMGLVWNVTCTGAGPHDFALDVALSIEPTQPLADPDPANNTGHASGTTQVGP